MRVEYHQTVDLTGHATITIEDIQAALLEAMCDADAEATRTLATAREKHHVLNRFVNAIHQCLEGISDEALAEASDTTRKLFSESLRKHADRWREKGGEDA